MMMFNRASLLYCTMVYGSFIPRYSNGSITMRGPKNKFYFLQNRKLLECVVVNFDLLARAHV